MVNACDLFKNGDLEGIQKLSRKYILSRLWFGGSYILEAARYGHLHVVEYILQLRTVDDTCDFYIDKYFVSTLFGISYINGHLELCKYIFDKIKDDNKYKLNTSFKYIDDEIMSSFLAITTTLRPIHYACFRKNQIDILKYLVEECNLKKNLNEMNEGFCVSVYRNNLNYSTYLLESNSNIDIHYRENECFKECFKKAKFNPLEYLCNLVEMSNINQYIDILNDDKFNFDLMLTDKESFEKCRSDALNIIDNRVKEHYDNIAEVLGLHQTIPKDISKYTVSFLMPKVRKNKNFE